MSSLESAIDELLEAHGLPVELDLCIRPSDIKAQADLDCYGERRDHVPRDRVFVHRDFCAELPDGLVFDGSDKCIDRLVKLELSIKATDSKHKRNDYWNNQLCHFPAILAHLLFQFDIRKLALATMGPLLDLTDDQFEHSRSNCIRRARDDNAARSCFRILCSYVKVMRLFQALRIDDIVAKEPVVAHSPPPIAGIDGISVHVAGTLKVEENWRCGDRALRGGQIEWEAEVTVSELDDDGFAVDASDIRSFVSGAGHSSTATCEHIVDLSARTLLDRVPNAVRATVRVYPHGRESGRYATAVRSKP